MTDSGGRAIRVLLADGKPTRRFGLRVLLGGDEGQGIEVVGDAENGDEAMKLAASARPEVVILDPALEHEGGSVLWLCGTLRTFGGASPKILLYCGADEMPEGYEDAREYHELSGAEGFVEAGESGEVLIDAIRRLHRGERVRIGI